MNKETKCWPNQPERKRVRGANTWSNACENSKRLVQILFMRTMKDVENSVRTFPGL